MGCFCIFQNQSLIYLKQHLEFDHVVVTGQVLFRLPLPAIIG